MSVVLITSDFIPSVGGVARYYAGLCSALPKDTVTVLAPAGPFVDFHAYRVIRCRFEFNWIWPRWLPLLWNAWRLLRTVRPDEVWVGQVLPVGTVVWLLQQFAICNMPYAVFTHGMDILVPKASPRKKWLMGRIFSGASRVVANSSFVRDELIRNGVADEKIVIVHPCAQPRYVQVGGGESAFRAQQGLSGKTIILTVARLVPRKGIDVILEALRTVIVANIVLIVVGGGPERARLEEIAIRNNLPVRFVGEVSDEELASWYAACDLFVLTPVRIGPDVEGFGMVYIEASMYGKACIGSKSGGISDAIIDGETGVLVKENDVLGLAQAIQKLVLDSVLRTRLGEAARMRAMNELQWSVQIKKLFT